MATKKKQTAKRIKKADFTQVVDSFHQALQDSDLGHLQVHSVTLVSEGGNRGRCGTLSAGVRSEDGLCPHRRRRDSLLHDVRPGARTWRTSLPRRVG